MKKLVVTLLVLALQLTMLAGCGADSTDASTGTVPAISVEGTMEELLNQVITEQPVEFMGGVIPIDLTDTSEEGQWSIKSFTGLDSGEQITEAAAYEPMISSIAFSMVMVRVNPEADSKTVAETMKAGIDTRKWICVEADDLLVTGYADVVMLVMMDSTSGLTAQSFVDAFGKVVGGEPEFVI